MKCYPIRRRWRRRGVGEGGDLGKRRRKKKKKISRRIQAITNNFPRPLL